MTKCCDIKAVVLPSAAVGTVLLPGAAELVADAILDLGLEMDYYQVIALIAWGLQTGGCATPGPMS